MRELGRSENSNPIPNSKQSILDLQLQNKYLLAKWLINLLNTNGMWQSLLINKYLGSKSLTQVKAKPYDSFLERSYEDQR